MDCLFCRIAEGSHSAERLWEDEKHVAFLDKSPIKEGHMLLIPKKHTEYIFDLSNSEYSDLFNMSKKFGRPLKKAMKAEKRGIVVEGYGVPHVHVHLIPLNSPGDLFRKVPVPTKEGLKATAEKIRREISF